MTKLKWCIKRTEENYKEVNEWFNKRLERTYGSADGYLLFPQRINGTCYNTDLPNGYTEITIDEFRLLTDPERFEKIKSYGGSSTTNERWAYVDGRSIPISLEVYHELQRMWKEREVENEFVHAATVEDIEADGIAYKKALIKEMEENPELFQLVAITCDKPTDQNKQLKLLKKIDKKLTKLIKKQNPKRHEKTIM